MIEEAIKDREGHKHTAGVGRGEVSKGTLRTCHVLRKKEWKANARWTGLLISPKEGFQEFWERMEYSYKSLRRRIFVQEESFWEENLNFAALDFVYEKRK